VIIDVIFEEEIAFQRSRESQMEIGSEIVPSPPSTVQRETTIIPVDLLFKLIQLIQLISLETLK
jgi:hypothetical protein